MHSGMIKHWISKNDGGGTDHTPREILLWKLIQGKKSYETTTSPSPSFAQLEASGNVSGKGKIISEACSEWTEMPLYSEDTCQYLVIENLNWIEMTPFVIKDYKCLPPTLLLNLIFRFRSSFWRDRFWSVL